MTQKEKTVAVKCPSCQTEMEWDSTNPNRPFCSAQCKNRDFCGWANEEHILPGSSIYDDLLSDELESVEQLKPHY